MTLSFTRCSSAWFASPLSAKAHADVIQYWSIRTITNDITSIPIGHLQISSSVHPQMTCNPRYQSFRVCHECNVLFHLRFRKGVQLSCSLWLQLLGANFTYVPYYITQDGNCLSNEEVGTDALSTQPLTLHKRLKLVLQDMHLDYRYVLQGMLLATY